MEDDVKKMIESKGNSSVIYAKYIYDHDKYPNKIFCFFEGEDYKYYRSRITQYLDINEEEIFHYDCNGKKEVLKVYEDLLVDENVKTIFFIDKDFDEDIDKEKIFQTDCYSIENYYVTNSAFKRFLSTEFEININDKNFRKCLNDYIKTREEFNTALVLLNAYISYIRKRDYNNSERIKLPKENEILNKLISSIEVDKVIRKSEKNINDIKLILNDERKINEEEILMIANQFKEMSSKELIFRGKFEIYFLKKFVTNLIQRIRAKEYFEDYNKNIKLDINNNIITYLTTYADTPNKLKKFLLNLKVQYCKNEE